MASLAMPLIGGAIGGLTSLFGSNNPQKALQANEALSSGAYNQNNTNAQGINSFLLPKLEQEAQNPQGFSSAQLGSQLTALEQGAGGANSGISGAGALQAARTRNSAGMSSVLDNASRNATKAFSQGALGVQNQNANLEQEKQQSALGALQGMYGTDTSAALNALGTNSADAQTQAKLGPQPTGFGKFMSGFAGGMGAGGGMGSMFPGSNNAMPPPYTPGSVPGY